MNKFGAKIKHIGTSKTIDKIFTGYCGKRGQMVPTESGGPILYVEDVKLQGGGKRYFERTVREYLRQHEEVEKGLRAKDNVYIREVDEDSTLDLTDQENLCVVSCTLPLEKEVRLLLGKDINSDYLLGIEGEIIKNTDIYDR
ncbi:MAG: hypothetical protein BWY64_01041 [bacterium ADurb.Bin363]|nr:MAG: hypothetical protein BWY64_01041 [bacterium ADurb.Bin363]